MNVYEVTEEAVTVCCAGSSYDALLIIARSLGISRDAYQKRYSPKTRIMRDFETISLTLINLAGIISRDALSKYPPNCILDLRVHATVQDYRELGKEQIILSRKA